MEKNIEETIFDFAYNAALNDATLRSAYIGEKDNIVDIAEARDVVKSYIDSILDGDEPNFYHAAEELCKVINNTEFRFGNAQKLINMTVKYIYIGAYTNKEYREKFKNCHCPMDSVMIRKVKMDYLNFNGNNTKDGLLQISVGEGKTSTDWSKVAWSKIDFCGENQRSIKIYENFQEMVKLISEKRGISPIEYDFYEWSI